MIVPALIGAGIGLAVGFTLATVGYVIAVEHGLIDMQQPGASTWPSALLSLVVVACAVIGVVIAL